MIVKKILAYILAGFMILTAVPLASNTFNDVITSTAEAAKGGAKMGGAKSAPKVNLNKSPSSSTSKPSLNEKTAPQSNSKSVSGGGKKYAPSKSAKDLPNKASTSKSNPSAAAASTSTGFGNTLRNIGLFAGGMMLGGLLGSMFGFSGGMFSDILGLLFNIIMIYALYRGGRYLWNKYRAGKDNQNIKEYQPIDPTPPDSSDVIDVTPPQVDYNPKRTAERYRNL